MRMCNMASRYSSGALIILCVLLTGCHSKVSRRKVNIGIQVSPAMTLVMVAKDAGLFEKQGIDVELKQFTAGKFALQSFLGGSVDFAVAGEVPVCLATLQGNRMRVVAQVVDKTTNEVRVVALNNSSDATNLDAHAYFSHRGRKLATSIGGGPEFFTYQFLQHHHINPADVQILSQRPEDMPAALQAGSVDAISIFDPFAYIAEQHLGKGAVTFRDPNLYSELYVLTASQHQIDTDGETISAVLRALAEAQTIVESDPARAKRIMQVYTKLDSSVVDGIWNNYSFKVTLNQRLINYWTEEAAWAKNTGKVPSNSPEVTWKNIPEPRFLRAMDASSVQF
jgi:ABC-type nitrate/sulfonate/bicarbonate transport system substrate-binding protein